jgi:hypothetical protein
MTSLISQTKQIPTNSGYYINVGDCRLRYFQNNGTDEIVTMGANLYALSTANLLASGTSISTSLATAGGAVFKDMGKTLVSSGRVFRKVQLVANTGADLVTGTAGVGGVDTAPVNYLTGYIELPGQHGNGGYSAPTPVARLG